MAVNITFAANGTQPTGAQWTLNYSATDFSSVRIQPTPLVTNISGEALSCSTGTSSVNCLVINLVSPSVLVPAGTLAVATFTISPTTTNTSSKITLSGLSATDGNGNSLVLTGTNATITINQTPPAPTLSSLNCSAGSFTPPGNSTCTVTLSGAAMTSTSVTLSSGSGSVTVPASVIVASGATTATFTANAPSAVVSTGTAVLTAALGGSSKTFTLTLNPAVTTLSSLSCSPGSFTPPGNSTCTVTLSSAVTTSTNVTLSSGGSGSVTVPASVTVASGATTGTFIANAPSSVNTPVAVVLTASLNSNTKTFTLNCVPSTALFVKTDNTTQGTWKGVYGADGEAIANDSPNYPAYAQVTFTGASSYTWSSSTTDGRALQKSAASDRIASTWYASKAFTIDVNLTDGKLHQVGVYCLDWDKTGRVQTIDILDAANGNALDSRSVSAFGNGAWLVWDLSGHVTISVALTGGILGTTAAVSGLFFDAAQPDFLISASPVSQTVVPPSSTSYTVNVGSLGGFAGTVSLRAGGLPSGATASFNPPSVSGSGSTTMTVTIPAGTTGGRSSLMVTGTSGSLTHSETVALVVNVPVPATALFVKTDNTTQGTWKGVYGADGEAIASDSANYPAYAQVTFNRASSYTWSSSTTDGRALQKDTANDRIASTWYSSATFTIDLNLTDGNSHKVGLYCLDWDNTGRVQTIDILDAASGNALDSRSVSAFSNGEWVVWNLAGHVAIRVTLMGGIAGTTAAVSGIFFSAPAASDFFLSATPRTQIVLPGGSTTYTATVNPLAGFTGTVNLSASGLPPGATAAFSQNSVSGSGSVTMTVTSSAATLGGAYSVMVTGTSGSVSHSGTAILVVNVAVPATALFVKTDSNTQGTWKGVYGADGAAIANDSTNYPAYAEITFSGTTPFTWNSSTTDVRALQKGAASDRIASTWYSASGFTIDMNLMDGNPHQVGLYCLDWDNGGRAETIDILDAASGNVLDSQSISGFLNGTWALWNIGGHVTIRVTRTSGANAVLNGLFINN